MKVETILPGRTVAEIEVSYSSKFKISELPTITDAKSAYQIFLEKWDKSKLGFVEQFKVLFLNRGNRVLGISILSTGGMTGTIVDARVLFAAALKCNACGIIIAHNHPSGRLWPSDSDRIFTRRIRDAGKLLDIRLIDHLIVTAEGFYSFEEEGAL